MEDTKKTLIKAAGFVILPRLDFEYTKDELMYQWLVTHASFRDETECARGQLIVTYTKLHAEFEWTYDNIRGIFKRLEALRLIECWNIKGKRGFLVTIRGYERMQNLGSYRSDEAKTETPTKEEFPKANSEDLTPLKFPDVFKVAFSRFPNEFQKEEILSYMNDGLTDEMVCLAIEKAARDNRQFPTARTIMLDWVQKDIKTTEAAIAEMKEFDLRKTTRSNKGQPNQQAPPEKEKEYAEKYGF